MTHNRFATSSRVRKFFRIGFFGFRFGFGLWCCLDMFCKSSFNKSLSNIFSADCDCCASFFAAKIFAQCNSCAHGCIAPGCGSCGRTLSRALSLFRAAVSSAVLAWWQYSLSSCRLSSLWSSPWMMWSTSVPVPSHRGSCVGAWHRWLSRVLIRVVMVGQSFGSLCLRSDVDHAMMVTLPAGVRVEYGARGCVRGTDTPGLVTGVYCCRAIMSGPMCAGSMCSGSCARPV